MNLAIKLNRSSRAVRCPLCNHITKPNIGAELTLADDDRAVCRECGREHAPALVALLSLAYIAGDYVLCERDFADSPLVAFDEAA